ncbi:hypothetical protein DFH08DRAFT_824713 [Mycena albidolilacea]|uniref:CxC2-like cysteine cluster KDZ transposase-associated domain-containing protein n=1 Tax=Mycena albidolilacea TaxID=1033008 RepID=A0AAD7EA39_9AGAR|nr:hypothetical protein DFH08DRAFT_824713 [Mycena albidolilacea]
MSQWRQYGPNPLPQIQVCEVIRALQPPEWASTLHQYYGRFIVVQHARLEIYLRNWSGRDRGTGITILGSGYGLALTTTTLKRRAQMVDTTLDNAFNGLKIGNRWCFYPCEGFEMRQGSEKDWFYVITSGRVPGIYTHWEDASRQVTRFPDAIHKKYLGWTAATSAWDDARRPVVCPSTPFTPPLASVSQAPFARLAANAAPVRARNPTLPRKHARKREAASAPPMPTGSNSKPLQQASSTARRGLIDGSFRKVEITPHLSEAFAYGTESALPVIDISDTKSVQRGGGSRKRGRNIFSLQSFGHTLKDPASTPSTARTGNLTSDGRRANVQIIELQPPEHPSGPSVDLSGDDDDWQDLPGPNTADISSATRNPARKRSSATQNPDDNLRYWVENFRDEYLRVLITREGTMGGADRCSCGEAEAVYRCNECHGMQMFCRACVVEAHRRRPLCRIEAWNGRFFERRELRQLGLRVQLGHADNQPCPCAHRGREKFVVIAPNGFHHVAVDFCQCRLNNSTHRWEQLLLYGWFPSTPDNPQSAVTISALKLFHAVSLQGKTTAYHFFNALAKITDNTGSRAFERRYQLVLRLVREWRNLQALKRGGMGNDRDRFAAETRDGELAVECIACPKVGVNLPEGWETASPERRFLFAVFWAFDACFRLKRKKISSWAADPSIQDGWAYFTAWKEYGPFVNTLGEQTEMSTCTGLAALDHANTKYAQGYAATGCGMVTCGRHEVVAKNGVGDLQAGEKYSNMDYVVASAWRHVRDLLFFLLSYDIMCQWSKNLKEHLLKLPPALRFHLAQYVVKFVIPKLHILGHLAWCQEFFSLLFTLGAAQADMEGIERIWSSSGLMGASTREMGPGSRQDTLDDFWHHWNWNKVVGMGLTLRTRLLKATKELERQRDGLEEFSEAQEEQVPVWRKMVDDFESGASLVNPYQLPKSGPTLREIELELAREEEKTERASATVRDATDGTMTEYLMLGLEIEGQQRQLAADLLAKRSPTAKELTDFVTRRTRISRQIKKLRLLQRKYSPGALQHLATVPDAPEAPESERTPLLLPSALSAAERLPPLSAPGLAVSEARLRDAQCDESLGLIRHGLSIKKRLQTYRSRNSRRQHQNTRSRTLVDSQQRKVDLAADTYRQARAARRALDDVAGASQWQQLNKADVRMLEDEEEAKKRKQRAMKGKRKEAAQENENGEVCGVPGMGEKNRLISWIWLSAGYTSGVMGESLYEGVRVEWCKAYARVKRWQEEVLLLQEEMARCLRSLEWQATVWDGRAAEPHYSGKRTYSPMHRDGAMVFAARQAALRRALTARFRRMWWSLTDKIEGPQAAASSELSGIDDHDRSDGSSSSSSSSSSEEEDTAGDDDGEAASDAGPRTAEAEGVVAEMSREERVLRRAEMDELLAIQSASVGQYDDI